MQTDTSVKSAVGDLNDTATAVDSKSPLFVSDTQTSPIVQALKSNSWIAGFSGAIIVAVAFVFFALLLPFGSADWLIWIMLIAMIPAVAVSIRYFAEDGATRQRYMKIAVVSIICFAVATTLIFAIHGGRIPEQMAARYARVNYNYVQGFAISSIVLSAPLVLILAYPASRNKWRMYITIILLPLLALNLLRRFFVAFFGIGKPSRAGYKDEELRIIKEKRGY